MLVEAIAISAVSSSSAPLLQFNIHKPLSWLATAAATLLVIKCKLKAALQIELKTAAAVESAGALLVVTFDLTFHFFNSSVYYFRFYSPACQVALFWSASSEQAVEWEETKFDYY